MIKSFVIRLLQVIMYSIQGDHKYRNTITPLLLRGGGGAKQVQVWVIISKTSSQQTRSTKYIMHIGNVLPGFMQDAQNEEHSRVCRRSIKNIIMHNEVNV